MNGIESTVIRITDMHNVWDEHGAWRGVQKNTKCFTPGWTYEIIPESKYPEMPIEDGVYRVKGTSPLHEKHVYLLDRKDGKWEFPNGSLFTIGGYEVKIIEKYKRVK